MRTHGHFRKTIWVNTDLKHDQKGKDKKAVNCVFTAVLQKGTIQAHKLLLYETGSCFAKWFPGLWTYGLLEVKPEPTTGIFIIVICLAIKKFHLLKPKNQLYKPVCLTCFRWIYCSQKPQVIKPNLSARACYLPTSYWVWRPPRPSEQYRQLPLWLFAHQN